MNDDKRNIVIVLRSGGDFTFKDVQLIVAHILKKWESEILPNIICVSDLIKIEYDLGNLKLIPLKDNLPGTWARMILYSPEMDKYRPFLYIDIDTVIIQSLEKVFDLVQNKDQYITLEDFWQKGMLATGLVWFPKNTQKTKTVWNKFKMPIGKRMDYFLRKWIKPDQFWQNLTDTIFDFKLKKNEFLDTIPENANLICFHGKPRIPEAALKIKWVLDYVNILK